MKRIVGSADSEAIMTSDDGMFTLIRYTSVGRNNVEYEALRVESAGRANDFVVEIRLSSTPGKFDEGEYFQYKYYTDKTNIAHGMAGHIEYLSETEDYIYVLECALDFARKVNQYIRRHKEWCANVKTAY